MGDRRDILEESTEQRGANQAMLWEQVASSIFAPPPSRSAADRSPGGTEQGPGDRTPGATQAGPGDRAPGATPIPADRAPGATPGPADRTPAAAQATLERIPATAQASMAERILGVAQTTLADRIPGTAQAMDVGRRTLDALQNPNRVISLLGNDNFEVRQRAQQHIVEQLGASALPSLRDALRNNPDTEIRRRAGQAIGGIYNNNEDSLLRPALRNVREWADARERYLANPTSAQLDTLLATAREPKFRQDLAEARLALDNRPRNAPRLERVDRDTLDLPGSPATNFHLHMVNVLGAGKNLDEGRRQSLIKAVGIFKEMGGDPNRTPSSDNPLHKPFQTIVKAALVTNALSDAKFQAEYRAIGGDLTALRRHVDQLAGFQKIQQ